MSTLVITRGIPGSGKTTWAKGWVWQDKNSRRRVNRDDLRMALFGVHWGLTREEEDQVTLIQRQQVSYLLRAGYDVVIDDTNLDADRLRALLDLAAEVAAEAVVTDFQIDLETAITRDFHRGLAGDRSVGPDVIRGFWERGHLEHGFPPVPQPTLAVPANG